MAREYFPKYSEVPKDIYEQVKGILRGYDRLKRERIDILYGSHSPSNGMPSGSGVTDETAIKASKLAYINQRLEAIDQTSVAMRGLLGEKVSEDFDPLKAFWNYNYFNCQHRRTSGKPNGPAYSTWKRYRYRYVGGIAKKLKLF